MDCPFCGKPLKEGRVFCEKCGREIQIVPVFEPEIEEKMKKSLDHVAEVFNGFPGKFVEIKDTIRSFKEILEGKHDNLPEQAFLFVGTIEEAVEKAKTLRG